MTRRTRICLLTLLLLLGTVGHVLADDTEVFIGDPPGIDPNVLIIFDNSGSMGDEIRTSFFDPAATYTGYYTPGRVYRKRYYHGYYWDYFRSSIAAVNCSYARTSLTANGFWTGRMYSNSNCGSRRSSTYELRTGDYLNYLYTVGDEWQEKIDVAKEVVIDLVESVEGVRFGLMKFNTSEGGTLVFPVQDIDDNNRADLIDDTNDLNASSWTPLAETLYEASLYFGGDASYYNTGVNYTSPIQEWCQESYVVLMTDGYSTQDRNVPWQIGSYDGDGDDPGSCYSIGAPYNNDRNCSDYLDDVASYMYDTDFSDLIEEQTVTTYAIGFDADYELLQDTAEQGNGEYYTADTSQDLQNAFHQTLSEIISRTTSFVAPVVPINSVNRTYSGDKIYLALFKPLDGGFWPGNIKKYQLADADDAEYERGDLLDVHGDKATLANGRIKDTAQSYWAIGPDGLNIEWGGVHEVLKFRATARKIYTYMGSNTSLNHSSNAFIKSNGGITTAMLAAADASERDKVIDWVHGYDPWDDDLDGDTTDKRQYMLGDFLHSRPSVIHYSSSVSVIYAGANDGMLHAFSDADGSELWAFVPPEVMPSLKLIHGDTHLYFVDSSPQLYTIDNDNDGNIEVGDSDKAYLIVGLRRGGTSYTILDITVPTAPVYVNTIDPADAGFGELGQSWGAPSIGTVCTSGGGDGDCDGVDDTTKLVAFFGAGYDTTEDELPIISTDTVGRGVYAIEVEDGDLFWSYTRSDDADMTFAIPSRVSVIDIDYDGYVDRLYFGDLGGQLWRFDVDDTNTNNWSGKVIFESNPGNDGSTGRKIFYEPDIVQEAGYEYLFFATGDRAHPSHTGMQDRLYALKDTDPATPLDETDLVDLTDNLLQDPDTSEVDKEQIKQDLEDGDGWYIELNVQIGEKALARPIVFGGAVWFNTFAPHPGEVEGDVCFVGDGTSRFYTIHYLYATAVMNLDESNDTVDEEVLERTDRTKIIGSGIPAGTIIAIRDQEAFAYTSVGQGVGKSKTPMDTVIEPVSWRQVF